MKTVILMLAAIMLLGAMPLGSVQLNGDVNCDGNINILDIVFMINYKYKTGPEPCQFVGSGVAYAHDAGRVIDLGSGWTNLIWLATDVPADGWVAIDFSHYISTEAYCIQYQIATGVPGKDLSEMTSYTCDMLINWHQILPVDSGMNWVYLNVRSCSREDGEKDRYDVTFNNINLSAEFIPELYVPIRDDD